MHTADKNEKILRTQTYLGDRYNCEKFIDYCEKKNA